MKILAQYKHFHKIKKINLLKIMVTLPGMSDSGMRGTVSLGGAKREAAERKEVCLRQAASERGFAVGTLI